MKRAAPRARRLMVSPGDAKHAAVGPSICSRCAMPLRARGTHAMRAAPRVTSWPLASEPQAQVLRLEVVIAAKLCVEVPLNRRYRGPEARSFKRAANDLHLILPQRNTVAALG